MARNATFAVTQMSQGTSRVEERMGRLCRTRNMIMLKYILNASFHTSYSATALRRFGDPLRVSSLPSLLSHCVTLHHCQHVVIELFSHHHLIVVALRCGASCHHHRCRTAIVKALYHAVSLTRCNSIVVASSSHHHHRCRTAIVKLSPCNLNCGCIILALFRVYGCISSAHRRPLSSLLS